jgi:hypothetical protein
MADNGPDSVKVAVKGELIALPWELVPPEVVKKALDLKAVRLECLPPLLQQAVIQLGFQISDNADENTVKTAMQEVSGAKVPPIVDLLQPVANQSPEAQKEKHSELAGEVVKETGRPISWVECHRQRLETKQTIDNIQIDSPLSIVSIFHLTFPSLLPIHPFQPHIPRSRIQPPNNRRPALNLVMQSDHLRSCRNPEKSSDFCKLESYPGRFDR